jgi:hypothetical protein
MSDARKGAPLFSRTAFTASSCNPSSQIELMPMQPRAFCSSGRAANAISIASMASSGCAARRFCTSSATLASEYSASASRYSLCLSPKVS